MSNNIILSYGDKEYLPIITSIGHNLKEKNLFSYKSKEIIDNGIYTILLYKTFYSSCGVVEQDIETSIENKTKKFKEINIVLTYLKNNFIRGFLYIDDKEYPINEYRRYYSLQIEKYSYDNVIGIRLPNNFIDGNYI